LAVVLRDFKQLKRSRNMGTTLIAIFLPVSIWYFLSYPGWWRVLTIFPLGMVLFNFRNYYAYQSGLNLEDKVGKILKELPDTFVLQELTFKQGDKKIKLPHLAVTPRGIFLVETRHRQGQIVDEGEKWVHYWVREKNIIDSPVLKVTASMDLIREMIREEAANLFPAADYADRLLIQPIVAFTNNVVDLKIGSSKVPVFRLEDFEKYIKSFRKKGELSPEVREKLARFILSKGAN
jgi:hypothetical protein